VDEIALLFLPVNTNSKELHIPKYANGDICKWRLNTGEDVESTITFLPIDLSSSPVWRPVT